MLNSVLQDAGFCWAWWVIAPIKTVSVCLHFLGINCDHGVLLLMYIPVFFKARSYDRHLKKHLRFKAGKSIPQFVARCLMMQLLLHPTLSLEDISREIAMIFSVHYTMMISIMLFVKKHSRLYQESIYLCDIDKEEHAEKEKLQKHIDNFLHSSKANDLDMVHLGGVPLAMVQTIINTVQNYDPGITILTGPATAAYLDYRATKHPIMLREESNFDVYLSMESLIEDLGIKLSVKEKQLCNQRFSQFEIPLLLKQISDRDKIKSTSKEATVKSIIESLN